MTLFRNRDLESDRSKRESQNESCRLLCMPMELRLQIYQYVIPPQRYLDPAINIGYRSRSKTLFSDCPLLHVSRQTRNEVYQLYFGTRRFAMSLKDFQGPKRNKTATVLDDNAIACLNFIKIKNDFECNGTSLGIMCDRHSSIAFLDGIKVEVDRCAGTVTEINRGPWGWFTEEVCCRAVEKVQVYLLAREVEQAGMHLKGKKTLAADDFYLLARQMEKWPSGRLGRLQRRVIGQSLIADETFRSQCHNVLHDLISRIKIRG